MSRRTRTQQNEMAINGFIPISLAAKAAKVGKRTVYRWKETGKIRWQAFANTVYVDMGSIATQLNGTIGQQIFWSGLEKILGKKLVEDLVQKSREQNSS